MALSWWEDQVEENRDTRKPFCEEEDIPYPKPNLRLKKIRYDPDNPPTIAECRPEQRLEHPTAGEGIIQKINSEEYNPWARVYFPSPDKKRRELHTLKLGRSD